jgi:hypothetical protein
MTVTAGGPRAPTCPRLPTYLAGAHTGRAMSRTSKLLSCRTGRFMFTSTLM